jgi:hypothetical protein
MRLEDFRSLVRRLSDEVPSEFFEGIAEVVVSPRAVPHPSRPEIFTLGECVPLEGQESVDSHGPQSRIVLYHGSFAALARQTPGFDWRGEAWETLTHELRHHLEWRAREPDLEVFDWAVEQNFARHDGERFDPAFYLHGERLGRHRYQVEDDVFVDFELDELPAEVTFEWGGARYRAVVPRDAEPSAFLTVEGLRGSPAGDVVLVIRRPPGLLALFRRDPLFQSTVRAERIPG